MPARPIVLSLLSVLAGCAVPDYTAVRDWARTAGIAADQPVPLRPEAAAAASPIARPARTGAPPVSAPPSGTAAGILAMQSALATYLAALATLASDGVLPYRDDPFAALVAPAASVHPGGGEAVAALGSFLRQASRANMQAPELRQAIATADPLVQALARALAASLATACAGDAACAEPVACQADLLSDIAATHAFLKANAGRITQEETKRQVRAAEDRLRRATLRLLAPADALRQAAQAPACPRPQGQSPHP